MFTVQAEKTQIKMRIKGEEVRLDDTIYTVSVVENILKRNVS